MKFLKNIYDAAEFYFFVIGITYITALLFWRNGVFVVPIEYFFTLSDTPLVISSSIYFISGYFLTLHNKKISNPNEKGSISEEIITISIIVLLLILYLITDFLSTPITQIIEEVQKG